MAVNQANNSSSDAAFSSTQFADQSTANNSPHNSHTNLTQIAQAQYLNPNTATNIHVNTQQQPPIQTYTYHQMMPANTSQLHSPMPPNMMPIMVSQQQPYQAGMLPVQSVNYQQSQYQQQYQATPYYHQVAGQVSTAAVLPNINSPQMKLGTDVQQPYLKKKSCYNCGSMNHTASECREPTIETSMAQTSRLFEFT